jgi:hypothetical protein
MKPIKTRICKDCKIEYTPFGFAQPRCRKCEYIRVREKQKTYKPLKVKRNLEQEAVNKQVRERDHGKPCISCGKYSKLEAGHYIPISKSKKLRYDLRNIHGQCATCNRFLDGNYKAYRVGLIERCGIDFVETLEQDLKNSQSYIKEE